MLRLIARTGIAAAVLFLACAVAQAQLGRSEGQQARTTKPALTAMDYAEIQQLYARYAFA
jgi:hypothetical protein